MILRVNKGLPKFIALLYLNKSTFLWLKRQERKENLTKLQPYWVTCFVLEFWRIQKKINSLNVYSLFINMKWLQIIINHKKLSMLIPVVLIGCLYCLKWQIKRYNWFDKNMPKYLNSKFHYTCKFKVDNSNIIANNMLLSKA